MIKAAKQAVSNILVNTDIIDGKLQSFTGAESLLNSYPLTYLSAYIKDIMSLTPKNIFYLDNLEESLLQNKLIKKIIIKRNVGKELFQQFWKQ